MSGKRENGTLEMSISVPLDPTQSEAYKKLDNDYDRWHAENTADYLKMYSELGYIDLSSIQRIVEFGAGPATSTIVLAQLAELNNGSVIALEKEEKKARILRESGLLPESSVITGDGFEYLGEMRRLGKKCDLLIAPFFGPDFKGDLIRSLIEHARDVLTPDGRLLAISDYSTISVAKYAFDAPRIPNRIMTTGTPEHFRKASKYVQHFGLITTGRAIQSRLLRAA